MVFSKRAVITYLLLMFVVLLSVIFGNLDEQLDASQAEIYFVLFLFTVVPGLLILVLLRPE